MVKTNKTLTELQTNFIGMNDHIVQIRMDVKVVMQRDSLEDAGETT